MFSQLNWFHWKSTLFIQYYILISQWIVSHIYREAVFNTFHKNECGFIVDRISENGFFGFHLLHNGPSRLIANKEWFQKFITSRILIPFYMMNMSPFSLLRSQIMNIEPSQCYETEKSCTEVSEYIEYLNWIKYSILLTGSWNISWSGIWFVDVNLLTRFIWRLMNVLWISDNWEKFR